MKKFESIMLQACWVDEGDFWAVSGDGYIDEHSEPESLEVDPPSFIRDFDSDAVTQQLKLIAECWLDQELADRVVILIDGNEVSTEVADEHCYMQCCTSGFVGNSPRLWAKSGGYTHWIDEAREWSRKDAEAIIAASTETHRWKLWPVRLVRQRAKLTVDIQDLTSETFLAPKRPD
jgi:hypothetical protein